MEIPPQNGSLRRDINLFTENPGMWKLYTDGIYTVSNRTISTYIFDIYIYVPHNYVDDWNPAPLEGGWS